MAAETETQTAPSSQAESETHFTFQAPHERPLVGLCGVVADVDQEVNARAANGNMPTCVVCFDLLRGLRG